MPAWRAKFSMATVSGTSWNSINGMLDTLVAALASVEAGGTAGVLGTATGAGVAAGAVSPLAWATIGVLPTGAVEGVSTAGATAGVLAAGAIAAGAAAVVSGAGVGADASAGGVVEGVLTAAPGALPASAAATVLLAAAATSGVLLDLIAFVGQMTAPAAV